MNLIKRIESMLDYTSRIIGWLPLNLIKRIERARARASAYSFASSNLIKRIESIAYTYFLLRIS